LYPIDQYLTKSSGFQTGNLIMKYTAVNPVDIRQTQHTLSAYVGDAAVLYIVEGGQWTVGPDATLTDIIRCSISPLGFLEAKVAA
jgi:hypothetical protein